jgi:hypothetical protein
MNSYTENFKAAFQLLNTPFQQIFLPLICIGEYRFNLVVF